VIDPRLPKGTSRQGVSATVLQKTYHAPDDVQLEALIASAMTKIAASEKRIGRRFTDWEVLNGLRKDIPLPADPMEKDQVLRRDLEVSQRRARDREPLPPPEKSAEERVLEAAERRLREERRARMSPAEIAVEDAREALAAKIASDQAAADREAFFASRAVVRLLSVLDDMIEHGMLDPDIDGESLDEMRHQRSLVMTHATPSIVETVTKNITAIQTQIAAGLDARETELRSALDALSQSRRALTTAPGTFDSIREVLVGSVPYIELSREGKTVSISRERWQGRASDEALAAMLFDGGDVDAD
jgi:hypothetical protein